MHAAPQMASFGAVQPVNVSGPTDLVLPAVNTIELMVPPAGVTPVQVGATPSKV